MTQRLFSPLTGLLLLIFCLSLLTACGESSDTGSVEDSETQNRLYVSLTDAEGDFTQYTVDVTALTLYRSNGATIETLPNTTTLDFAQYIDVTEFLTTAIVPPGYYNSAEISLDFSSAQLTVENSEGESVPTSAIDDAGDPLGELTVTVNINGQDGFHIRPGQPASLNIDFDLESSNIVELADDGLSATVIVNPVLIANTSIDDEKTRRVRGLLSTVDIDAQTFVIDIRPFRVRHHSHGELTVYSDDQTRFEIDGYSYQGSQGLIALDDLSGLVPMVVLGQFDHQNRRFSAEEVFAGSSVPWGERDVLKGSVIARSGDELSIIGATVELDNGQFQFNDEFTILVDDTTTVVKQGTSGAFSIDDISIGQRVEVLGEVTDDNTFNAATGEGLVRMRYSDVAASVAQISPLQVDVQHINRRITDLYDFNGTGIDEPNDADPEAYEIDEGSLPLSSLSEDTPVWIRGFPTTFGTAPADFEAKSIADVSQLTSKLYVGYGKQGSASAVASLDDTGLLLDLGSAVDRHHLKQAGIVTDLNDFNSMPLIEPNDGHALYVIQQGHSNDVYIDWAAFQSAINQSLLRSQVIMVHASGQFDTGEGVLTSRHVVIRMTE